MLFGYCTQPTGEYHFSKTPLAKTIEIFSLIYRSLSPINRSSRHISMTISAGKLAVLGTSIINGEKCFALKFTEARNMECVDRVFHAKYNETENRIDFLTPFDTDKYFFEDELVNIETELAEALQNKRK